MKKETYLRKLDATVITDKNTAGEAKTAKRVESELKRFWKKSALDYLRRTEPEAVKHLDGIQFTHDVEFDLKPAGTIKVKIYDVYGTPVPYPPYRHEVTRYTVRKRDLLT